MSGSVAQREDHAAHEARVDREADDRDGDHRVAQARPEARDDGDGQEDVRKRHQDVGEPHHHGLDPPRVKTAENPEHYADHHRGGRRGHTGEQGHARAPDETRQQIAPELVGPQPVTRRQRRPQAVRRVHGIRIEQREPGREQGDEHRGEQDERGHQREAIAACDPADAAPKT